MLVKFKIGHKNKNTSRFFKPREQFKGKSTPPKLLYNNMFYAVPTSLILMNFAIVEYERISKIHLFLSILGGGHFAICCRGKMTSELLKSQLMNTHGSASENGCAVIGSYLSPTRLWCHFQLPESVKKWPPFAMAKNGWILRIIQNTVFRPVEAHETYYCEDKFWLTSPLI